MARFQTSCRGFVAVAAVAFLISLTGCRAHYAGVPCGTPCDGPSVASPCASCAAPCGVSPCAASPCAAPCASPCAGPAPSDVECGQVWCRCWEAPIHKTVAETVCVKAPCKKTVWLPPQYGVRPKLCCCAPARLEEKVRPPIWTTKERDVCTCPEQERWQKVCCPPACSDDPCAPQECWQKTCTPATWGKECCPVCVAPEAYCVQYVAPQYKMVQERYLVEPGRCQEICEPAMYETRFHEVCCRPGRWVWRRNARCEVPKPVELPALQVEMTDKTQDGEVEGIFRVGQVVRYDLTIRGDLGKKSISGLRVVFALPPELEFVSATAEEGVAITGSGHAAQSSVFSLPADGSLGMSVLAKVVAAPPNNFVQFSASVQSADGTELAVETESTTLGPAPGDVK